MTIKPEYKGIIEWHIGEPPKKGKYLVTVNKNITDVALYYKVNGKNIWRSFWESENGGYMTFDRVYAWAYLPEPYKG